MLHLVMLPLIAIVPDQIILLLVTMHYIQTPPELTTALLDIQPYKQILLDQET